MKLRSYSLFLLFACGLTAGTALAAVKEGGSDGGHSGGGGTFISTDCSKGFKFWDIFNTVSLEGPKSGDELRLSVVGQENHGERIDSQMLRLSQGFMESRLDLWRKRSPNLFAALKKQNQRGLNLIATDLSIQRVAELATSKYSWIGCNPIAIPGAFFEYPTQVLFVDINIWNRADLKSQSALLLHERLRDLQVHYPELSNNDLQAIVSTTLFDKPGEGMPLNDAQFDLKFYQEGSVLAPLNRQAGEEIRDAVAKGILGSHRGDTPLQAEGVRNGIEEGDGKMEIEPLTCERRLKEILNGESSGLNCQAGLVSGQGSMHFTEALNSELRIEIGAALLENGAQISAEILKKSRAETGIQISFTRANGKVRVNLGGRTGEMDFPQLSEIHNYTIIVSRRERSIQVISENRDEQGNDIVIAKIPLLRSISRSRPNIFKFWDFQTGDRVKVQFINVYSGPSSDEMP